MTEKPRVLCFGSINEDRVYRVPHIVRPGETIAGTDYRLFAGGKGANQSVALAHAGVDVHHAGKLGTGAQWLREKLASEGVNVDLIQMVDEPTGHALIQVDDAGENSIVLFGGTNQSFGAADIEQALHPFTPGDYLLLQNEINVAADLIRQGADRGLNVVFNPAPATAAIRDYPLDRVDILILNEHEATELVPPASPQAMLNSLARLLPHTAAILTLGSAGALGRFGKCTHCAPSLPVQVVDTTGAGDTFIGFFLAALLENRSPEEALNWGCRAAAIAVTRPGAMDAIPRTADLNALP